MKKILHWLDENLEEFLLVFFLIAMTLIMGIQIFCRYVLGQSLSWSEEITRYLFIWSGFLIYYLHILMNPHKTPRFPCEALCENSHSLLQLVHRLLIPILSGRIPS